MNSSVVYEAPQDGVMWSIVVFMFVVAGIIIGIIWNKIGQGKK